MNKNEQGVNLIDLLVYLASKWKWFLLSVLICVGFAWYKYASAPLVYFGKATVIIKDPFFRDWYNVLYLYNREAKVNFVNPTLQKLYNNI